MTDREVFTKFMVLLGLDKEKEDEVTNGNTFILYKGSGDYKISKNMNNFTSVGYEDFITGAVFNEQGEIVQGFFDSHVANRSESHELLIKLFNFTWKYTYYVLI